MELTNAQVALLAAAISVDNVYTTTVITRAERFLDFLKENDE